MLQNWPCRRRQFVFAWISCTVLLVFSIVMLYHQPDTGAPPCSHQILQKLYWAHRYFPSRGSWDPAGYFHPRDCTLLSHNLTGEDVCLPRLHLSYIVSIGDSNAKRHFDAFVREVGKVYQKCEEVRMERLLDRGFVPEKEYFARDDPDLVSAMKTGTRKCRSCASRKVMCTSRDDMTGTGTGNKRLMIEHIAMPLMMDTSLTVSFPHPKFTETFQEYIFKYYLRDQNPDFIVIFPPFNHMKQHDLLVQQKLSIDHVVELVERYHQGTPVFWMPCTAEIEEQKPDKWRNNKMNGMDSSQRISQLNQHLYKKLHPLLIQTDAHNFGFFDLHNLSFYKRDWNHDGVHFKLPWYDRVMNNFLQLLCNSQ